MTIDIQTLYLRSVQIDNWLPYSVVMPFYRTIAGLYDAGAEVLMPDYDLAIGELLNRLHLASDDRLLDVATGTGKVLLAAQPQVTWSLGIDLSPKMLAQLRRKSNAAVIALADARLLSLATKQFTVATTSFMLLHSPVQEKQRVLSNMANVLRPGGHIGCLTSTERVANAYSTRTQWHNWLMAVGCERVAFYEFRKVYRIVVGQLQKGS